ncbi:Tetracycline repressor protein class E [Austwickia sp. TVS 96-490-7B]|uniref:TetR family transcriptional regulator n=1 Tax=Austwickia sp. TVS 96-490-7B TaxID=2830843 RepID=UPI001D351EB9|nr:TetR/AcrR family transcriptional regulator C-terminal domain-containing protein [Austwickia sp. TVS 96-490-7B]MBW3085204.1 Tetracycline repressor protein class E [Austwickia sp. TVS 96-490-7B]
MNRQDILDQALTILDQYGFADLSMRRLATALGVQPGALYWHFANKQTLLSAVAEVILADVPTGGICDTGSWQDGVREWATSLHHALLAHRDGAELVASVLALRPEHVDPARIATAILHRAGLPALQAEAAAAALVHYVVGHAVDAQNRAQARLLGVQEAVRDGGEDWAGDSRFRYGLDLFIDGLDRRLTERTPPCSTVSALL